MNFNIKSFLGIIVAAIFFIIVNSLYIVKEWETGIVFRLGEIVKADVRPGLHIKTPFVNNVKTFDARLQTLDAKPERYLTSEKKNLIVDSFVKWRINDVEKYFTTMGGDKRLANMRLSQVIKDGLRAAFGSRNVQEVISGSRSSMMKQITENANKQATEFGIKIADIRLKRVDLSNDVSDSVFRRMEAERKRVAKDLRAKGSEAAEKIRADADRQKVVILANAYREAEKTRGIGDAKSADIYAKAYKIDKEFYDFYKSLQSYQSAFRNKSDIILVDPNNEYFKYFKSLKK